MLGRLYDTKGRQIQLGRKLGSGGEGGVYEVPGEPDVAAKIYHRPVAPRKAEKLVAMAGCATADLLKISAWPTDTLWESSNKRLVGIVMPRVVAYREIHRMYSPAHRKVDFPNADWAFLVHTARNLTATFETIHAHGHVVGDVNQGNVVVSSQGLVKFIDCDSFQVTVNGRRYVCEVGVGHFTPPELQGYPFEKIVRTRNHDAFGLAVLCFHLLFMGRQPFAGRFRGRDDMPIERAIREFRFAFSRSAPARQMTPPPYALGLADVSVAVADLFERAFGEAGVRDGGRPSATEWMSVLEGLRRELRACERYAAHKYFRGLSQCPWCEIERQGGPYFFISLTEAARLGLGFDLTSVWAAIVAVMAPEVNLPARPAGVSGTAVPAGFRLQRLLQRLAGWSTAGIIGGVLTGAIPPAGFTLAIIIGIIWLVLRGSSSYDVERKKRKEALRVAQQAFGEAERRWQREVGGAVTAFQAKHQDLERKRSELQGLPAAYQRERAGLHARREELQRMRFLEKYFIDGGRIKGIGLALKAVLLSYGIETAADITRKALEEVPGFGAARTSELLKWRTSIERQFRFDSTQGVDPRDIAALDQRYAVKRQELERSLRAGPQELQMLRRMAIQRRDSLIPELQRVGVGLAKAEADAALV